MIKMIGRKLLTVQGTLVHGQTGRQTKQTQQQAHAIPLQHLAQLQYPQSVRPVNVLFAQMVLSEGQLLSFAHPVLPSGSWGTSAHRHTTTRKQRVSNSANDTTINTFLGW